MENDLPKLRLAPRETHDELLQRLERENRAESVQRESALESSLAPFRVGSVPYLNTAPLTRGIDDQIIFATPAKLGEMLRRDEIDAGLISVTEVLFHDRYDVLDGIAIASLGEVQSVLLAHRQPIPEIREVFLDPASLASVNLLKVLLAEKGLHPDYRTLAGYEPASLPDTFLMIGDPAIRFLRSERQHEIWDLGTAWFELTGLPFVFAVWALRRGIDTTPLRPLLREAKDFGLDTLEWIIQSRTEFDYAFRKDYLGWHIHYHLGGDEKRGMARFVELLRKHGFSPVYEPRFAG